MWCLKILSNAPSPNLDLHPLPCLINRLAVCVSITVCVVHVVYLCSQYYLFTPLLRFLFWDGYSKARGLKSLSIRCSPCCFCCPLYIDNATKATHGWDANPKVYIFLPDITVDHLVFTPEQILVSSYSQDCRTTTQKLQQSVASPVKGGSPDQDPFIAWLLSSDVNSMGLKTVFKSSVLGKRTPKDIRTHLLVVRQHCMQNVQIHSIL